MPKRATQHLYLMELLWDLVTEMRKYPAELQIKKQRNYKSQKKLNTKSIFRFSYSREIFITSLYQIG